MKVQFAQKELKSMFLYKCIQRHLIQQPQLLKDSNRKNNQKLYKNQVKSNKLQFDILQHLVMMFNANKINFQQLNKLLIKNISDGQDKTLNTVVLSMEFNFLKMDMAQVNSVFIAKDHDYTAIDMDQFTKYDWGNIQWLGLYGCAIDDKAWRLFVDKANLFSKLKILGIKDNTITTLKQGDLQAFKSLRLVQFGTVSGSNPLTQQSRQYLKKFKQENKHIKVKFKF